MSDPSPETRPSRRDLVAIGAAALVVRAVYVAVFLRHYSPDSDARQYVELATSVARGHGLSGEFPFWFSHVSAFRPPLYPALLGLVFRIFGTRLLAGMLANVVLGAAVVVLVALVAAPLGGRRAALAAGAVAAVAPPLLFNDGVTLSEPLSLVLLLAAMLLLLERRVIAAAVAVGLLTLTRPSAQALFLALAAWVLVKVGWRQAVRFVVVALVVVVPWIARNYVELGTPTLVTSNGFNLAATYSPAVRAHHGFVDPFFSPAFATVRYQHFTEPQLDSRLRRVALDDLRDHPRDLGVTMRRNLAYMFEIDRKGNEPAERLDGRPIGFRRATLPAFYMTLLLGVAGWYLARKRAATRLVLLVAGYFFAVNLLTLSPPRLRAPIDVMLYAGAGVAISALVGRFRREAAPALRDADDPAGDAVATEGSERRRRASPGRVFFAVAASMLLATAGTAFVARGRVEGDATHQARALARSARRDVATLRGQYPVDGAVARPDFAVDGAPDRLLVLDGEMWALVPRLSGGDKARVQALAEALYDSSIRSRLLVLMMLSAAHDNPQTWSLADVRRGYEQRLRPTDATLPPWDELLAADAIEAAQRALGRL